MEIIEDNNWFLEIDLNGGRIKELRFKDEVILGTFLRIDGKNANTHICCPNFGNEGMEKFNLPFHGPFRNTKWNLIIRDINRIEIEAIDLGLKIKQIFKLENGFEQFIEVENIDQESKLVNVAIHNYWEARNGWKGTRLNREIIDDLISLDTDKEILDRNILEIPGKSKYNWQLNGFKYGQFWVGFNNDGNKKKYDQSYFCVEPALERQGFLEKGQNNLPINGKIYLNQKISLL